MKKLLIGLLLLCFALASCNVGDPEAPGTPLNFQFVCDASTMASTCAAPNARLLYWIAPGDDGYSGQALQYDLRWSYEPMSEEVFKYANQFIDEPAPQPTGNVETIFLPRMIPGVGISFGLKAYDEVADASGLAATGMVQLDFINTPMGSYGVSQPGFGTVTQWLADINGLGTYDYAVGAPGAVETVSGEARGAVYVYFNGTFGNLMTYENGLLRSAPSLEPSLVIYGEALGDQFGQAVSNDGDFNGDGISDLAVGAPGAGKVYVFFGGSAGIANFAGREVSPANPVELSANQADVIITGPAAGFGMSLALLGDIDGLRPGSELLVGSPGEARAYLFYSGLSANNRITGTPPINITLPAGTCTLPPEGCADWTLIGPGGSDFGKVVTRMGDIDGGVEDMAVSAPSLGEVYVFIGGGWGSKALVLTNDGPQAVNVTTPQFDLKISGNLTSEFGASISARRDVSGSGYATIIIGAPGEDSVYVLNGGPGGALSLPTTMNHVHNVVINGWDRKISSGTPGYRFGESVNGMGDYNGDYTGDILVGAPDAVGADGATGAVYEFLSGAEKPASRTTADADYTLWGHTPGGKFGSSLAAIGDVVTHSPIYYYTFYDDFITGAPGENAAGFEY